MTAPPSLNSSPFVSQIYAHLLLPREGGVSRVYIKLDENI